MQQQTVEAVKTGADIASGITVVGVLAGLIPWLAALASLVWTVLRIYEMVTGNPAKTLFQKWRKRAHVGEYLAEKRPDTIVVIGGLAAAVGGAVGWVVSHFFVGR